jgi:hypothetical protein
MKKEAEQKKLQAEKVDRRIVNELPYLRYKEKVDINAAQFIYDH